ncbi:MAG: LytTR family DNA-binding domain-containing protein [Ferruginibacter sp.]
MIKAAIIDDEQGAANVFRLMLERHVPEINEIAVETRSEKAIAFLQQYKPDLVFLDILMPALNGFDLLNRLGEIPFDVIFTTAHDGYAIQAIRFSAVDYLLKPIDADELKAAVQRVIRKKQSGNSTQQILDNLSYNLKIKEEDDLRFTISTSNGIVFFKTNEVMRIEGEGNYSRIILTGNRVHVCAKTLKDFEELLSPLIFLRIHKSYIVNKNFIVNYLNKGEVVLNDASKFPVSRRKKTEVSNILLKRNAAGN